MSCVIEDDTRRNKTYGGVMTPIAINYFVHEQE